MSKRRKPSPEDCLACEVEKLRIRRRNAAKRKKKKAQEKIPRAALPSSVVDISRANTIPLSLAAQLAPDRFSGPARTNLPTQGQLRDIARKHGFNENALDFVGPIRGALSSLTEQSRLIRETGIRLGGVEGDPNVRIRLGGAAVGPAQPVAPAAPQPRPPPPRPASPPQRPVPLRDAPAPQPRFRPPRPVTPPLEEEPSTSNINREPTDRTPPNPLPDLSEQVEVRANIRAGKRRMESLSSSSESDTPVQRLPRLRASLTTQARSQPPSFVRPRGLRTLDPDVNRKVGEILQTLNENIDVTAKEVEIRSILDDVSLRNFFGQLGMSRNVLDLTAAEALAERQIQSDPDAENHVLFNLLAPLFRPKKI